MVVFHLLCRCYVPFTYFHNFFLFFFSVHTKLLIKRMTTKKNTRKLYKRICKSVCVSWHLRKQTLLQICWVINIAFCCCVYVICIYWIRSDKSESDFFQFRYLHATAWTIDNIKFLPRFQLVTKCSIRLHELMKSKKRWPNEAKSPKQKPFFFRKYQIYYLQFF